jgi:membrane protein
MVSGAFRLYLSYFDSYAATYGSLGAMIILLLWLYLTALVILIGGAINAILDEKSGIEKKAEDPQQVAQEETGTGKESKT